MHPWLRQIGIGLFVWGHLLILQACAQVPDGASGSLQQMLAAPEHPYLRNEDLPRGLEALRGLYEKHAFAPIWQRSGKPTTQAQQMVRVLRDAGAYGLRPSDYDADLIDARMRELLAARDAQAARRAEFDLRLSGAALRLATHLHYGRVDPRSCGFELTSPRPDFDRIATIESLSRTSKPGVVLAAVEPQFLHYRYLKTALAKYRPLAADRTLTALPRFAGRSIKPGAEYSGAPALRRLLAALGDLGADAAAAPGDETLDDALAVALRSFQQRNGLPADGVLGRKTFAALTVPLARRVRQIEITLERWRWLPALEMPPIIVNLPAFRLYAFPTAEDRESDMLRMDVIVGQSYPETQTPIFLAEMKYLVFQPYWDVPDTILQREILPEIRGDPKYLEKNRMELVSGQRDNSAVVPPTPENIEALASGALRLRQQPGEDNALGAIKFVLPNYHNVYLHSTPSRRLFKESSRAFSHGCIRVSDPVGLAEHVLRNEAGNWTAEKVELAMSGEPNQRVNLSTPVQVMILYVTAVAAESGRVLFYDDIYEHDKRLESLLRARNR